MYLADTKREEAPKDPFKQVHERTEKKQVLADKVNNVTHWKQSEKAE